MKAPAKVAASTAAAPRSDASRILPLRKRYMYQPTKSAIGIVQAIVNVPHELPGTSRRAFSGKTQPLPSGLLLQRSTRAGTVRSNVSWKIMVWPGPSPKR